MTATTTARKRVLCVDDDEETRIMMSVLLGQCGYEAVIAGSSSDALNTLQSGGIVLCILDNWMNDSSGIELCRQIRDFDPETPIIFYSGAAYTEDIQKGLNAGAQAYLVKPDFDRLTETIDRLT